METVWRCDITKNPVGTDTEIIGHPCQCQGCRMVAEIERLQLAFYTAHGALLCIGGTDSNWSEYARNVANESGSIVLNDEQSQETN